MKANLGFSATWILANLLTKVEWATSGLGICPITMEAKEGSVPTGHSTWRMVITAPSSTQCI